MAAGGLEEGERTLEPGDLAGCVSDRAAGDDTCRAQRWEDVVLDMRRSIAHPSSEIRCARAHTSGADG